MIPIDLTYYVKPYKLSERINCNRNIKAPEVNIILPSDLGWFVQGIISIVNNMLYALFPALVNGLLNM